VEGIKFRDLMTKGTVGGVRRKERGPSMGGQPRRKKNSVKICEVMCNGSEKAQRLSKSPTVG